MEDVPDPPPGGSECGLQRTPRENRPPEDAAAGDERREDPDGDEGIRHRLTAHQPLGHVEQQQVADVHTQRHLATATSG